jgi:hypothetical protein
MATGLMPRSDAAWLACSVGSAAALECRLRVRPRPTSATRALGSPPGPARRARRGAVPHMNQGHRTRRAASRNHEACQQLVPDPDRSQHAVSYRAASPSAPAGSPCPSTRRMTGEYVPGLRIRLGGPPRKWLAMGLSQRCQGFVDLPGRLLRARPAVHATARLRSPQTRSVFRARR